MKRETENTDKTAEKQIFLNLQRWQNVHSSEREIKS